MGRELMIVKVPRSDEILNKPISFAPLQNLHLDLIEVKKKLKKGLPAVTIKKTPPKPIVVTPPVVIPIAPAEDGEDIPDEIELDVGDADDDGPISDGPLDDTGDDDMLKELGGDTTPSAPETGPSPQGTQNDPNESAAVESPQEPDPYEGLSPEERESKEKEEYIWRFRILKKQYKERDIPSYNEHDDLPQMKTTYERTIKEIRLENNVDSYRTYLVGGFMVMEFVFTNWVGADLTGFTTQQMAMMDKYDTMLIELGERSYNRWGTNFPIEIRLIGFILLQAGLFYLGKIIAEKAGTNISTIFKGLTGQPIKSDAAPGSPFSPAKPGAPAAPTKKMRGPSIRVSDIKRDDDAEEA